MSGISISALPAVAAALRPMELEVNDAGTSRKMTVDQLLALTAAKPPVRAATTANLASLSGLLTVDGIVLSAGDRVLVKDQTTPAANGIYVAAAGAWTRAPDADAWDEGTGALVPVMQGTVNADRIYLGSADPGGSLGTTAITWTQVGAGGGPITASGLTIATARLAGRTGAGSGALEEIAVGTGLSLSGGTLACTVTGGAGTVTSITAGGGLTGGTITGAGTIAVDTSTRAIGQCILAHTTVAGGVTVADGATVAGSSLNAAMLARNSVAEPTYVLSGSALSGTWRNLSGQTVGQFSNTIGTFVRIA